MSRKLLLPLALVGVTAMGVFAASGIGSATSDREALAGDRERVTLDVVRDQGGAAAASAITSAKKGKKKVKIQHFVASSDVDVPPNGGTDILSLTCPGKAKVLSGDYATDGFIYVDWFAAASAKRWEFAFADENGDGGLASPGITCAKGVK
jgi:hypothetical protein